MAEKKPAATSTSATPVKPSTKTQILQALAETTGLSRKQVVSVFEEMTKLIKRDLSKKGPGIFTIPGLLKLQRKSVPARKARPGKNPFNGEDITIKARPASTTVKAKPLKSLKDLIK